jgi:2-keto-4-pentenoate hydratase/2-oxohepta-3-ene-1,7-dioic acid hydratase in catechol pathway
MFSPSKIVAIGKNYYGHIKEIDKDIQNPAHEPYPIIFLKPPTTVIQNGDTIIYPPQTQELHYEGELAIVIKDKIKNISKEEAPLHILGYTCANDVTARDLQRLDGQWTRSKSFDTFCPLGPAIVSGIDPFNLEIFTRVNGQVKQHSNTKYMEFDAHFLVAYVSQMMTLLPGDVIITGTPEGIGPIQVGDTVEVEVEKIGILKNIVGKG